MLRPPFVRPASFAFALCAAGCVTELDDGPPLQGAIPDESQGVVVGDLDWFEATALPDDDPRRVASRSVAYLWVPQMGHRCTGFLVDDDVIATARHCVPDASAAPGLKAAFTYEAGSSSYGIASCGAFLGSDAALDAALLRCESAPGYAPLAFVASAPADGADAYLVHQNCMGGACDPTKKISPGHAIGTNGSWLYHDADMLPGSSGGPLLDAALHAVVGMNFASQPQDIDGYGSFNIATLSSSLRAFFDGAGVATTWIDAPPPAVDDPPPAGDPPENDVAAAPAIRSPDEGAHVDLDHVDLACTAVDGATGYRFILEYERDDGFAPYHTWTTTQPSKRVWPVREGVRYRLRASIDADDAPVSEPIEFTFR